MMIANEGRKTRTRRMMRAAIVALALGAMPRASAMAMSNTYACTAYCSGSTGCGAGNVTNGVCPTSTYQGCVAATCSDACDSHASAITAGNGVANVTYGSTSFTCFNSTKMMWSTQAVAEQLSVALNCTGAPGAHFMNSTGAWMQGANHMACSHGSMNMSPPPASPPPASAASTDERAMALVIATVLAVVGNAALA